MRKVAAALTNTHVKLVDVFTDESYARSSFKLVGNSEQLASAAEQIARAAILHVDLSLEQHPAPHPRQGALDMVAFMPLSEEKADALVHELDECALLAQELGSCLGGLGLPVLLYGPRRGRSLLDARRCTSFFASTRTESPREPFCSAPPDFGPETVSPRSGIAIVGAMPYVTNFNVQIRGADLGACRSIALELRKSMGLQLMALPHADDSIEIGCNLQATAAHGSPGICKVLSSMQQLLPSGASIARSYVIGLTPSECLDRWRGKSSS